MEDKKDLKDYTLKEMYINFSDFEEKFANSINNSNIFENIDNDVHPSFSADNNFLSRLKFVKALNQYRKQLELMPHIHKYSAAMVDRILGAVQSVETRKLDDELVKYDKENGKILFNSTGYEGEIFDKTPLLFTEIALERVHTEHNGVNYKALDQARIEYIAHELPGHKIDFSNNAKIYKRLVDLFGEERMLNLNSSNISKLQEDFSQYNGSLEWFEEDFEEYNNLKNVDKEKSFTALKNVNDTLDLMEKNRNLIADFNKKPTDRAQEQIDEFKKVLYNCKDIPQEFKQKMVINLEQGVKDIEEKKIDERWSGVYSPYQKKVQLKKFDVSQKNEKYKVTLHELMHAATISRDKFGRPINRGSADINNCRSTFITEGVTEYFAQKMYLTTDRPKMDVSYPELVAVVGDLTNLYGQDVMLDAMLNGPQKLEELMAKDGKSYSELIEISDDYYREVYNNKEKTSAYIVKKEEKSKEMYAKVGCFVEEIKTKRQLENPEKVFQESEWQKAYNDLLGAKNELSWFQKFKNILKEKFNFNKKENPLLLNEGNSAQNLNSKQEQEAPLTSNSALSFKESLKVNKYDNRDNISNEEFNTFGSKNIKDKNVENER